MGVRITPCFRCPLRLGCEQRDDFRRRAAKTGAVSIRFRCNILAARLKPGVRVKIPHAVPTTGYQYDGEEITCYPKLSLPATILTSDGYRFSAVVDHDQTDEEGDPLATRFRRTMPAYRIVEFLDEPARRLCNCGNVVLPDGRCDRKDGPSGPCSEDPTYFTA